MNTVFIYSLNCPITNIPKYIGKTKHSLQRRLTHHYNDLRGVSHKNNWIRSLKNNNLKPLIEEVDMVSENEWAFWEQYWICQFKTWGFNLTNNSIGGNGAIGTKHTGQALENIREAIRKRVEREKLLGITLSPFKNKTEEEKKAIHLKVRETRLKRGGYKMSENAKKKISIFNKGKKLTEEHKKKLSDFRKLTGVHPITRQKSIESKSKAIFQIDLKGNIKEWFSAVEASKILNINVSSIRSSIKRGNMFNGFNWKYK